MRKQAYSIALHPRDKERYQEMAEREGMTFGEMTRIALSEYEMAKEKMPEIDDVLYKLHNAVRYSYPIDDATARELHILITKLKVIELSENK